MPFRTLTRTRTHALTQDAAALEEELAAAREAGVVDPGTLPDETMREQLQSIGYTGPGAGAPPSPAEDDETLCYLLRSRLRRT